MTRPGARRVPKEEDPAGWPALRAGIARVAKRHRIDVGLLFVLPALSVYLLYVVWPIASTAYHSLFDWDGVTRNMEFIGLDNYVELLTRDYAFRSGILNNVRWAAIAVSVLLVGGFVLAYALSQPIRGRTLFRTAMFLPTAASVVVIAFVWAFIYDPNQGPLNTTLRGLGFDGLTRTWMADPTITFYAVVTVAMWASIGFFVVVLVAAIGSVSHELFEAASIDGASAFARMRHIALPLTMPALRSLLILVLIAAVNEFGFVFLLSDGGPFHASEVMAYQIYDLSFALNRTGYASALSMVLLTISLVITLPQLRSLRSGLRRT